MEAKSPFQVFIAQCWSGSPQDPLLYPPQASQGECFPPVNSGFVAQVRLHQALGLRAQSHISFSIKLILQNSWPLA